MPNKTKLGSITKTTTTTATFLPTSITGCSLWLDAADPTTITGTTNVSQWNDKSGSSRNVTQSTSGNQPTYSSTSNAMVFNGNQYLNIPNALAAITPTYTVFVVDRRASANVMFFVGQHDAGSANSALILGYNATNVSHHTTAYVADCQVTIPSYAGASEPMRINRYDYSGTTRDTYINGGQYSTSQSFSNTLTTWTNPNIGAGFSSSTYSYIGNLYEIIFYNNVLTTTQQQTVESYLAQKWSLTSSLPTGHPGLTTAVYQYLATVPAPITTTRTIVYLPTSIAGCQLWLDAADATSITQSGGTVSQWNDKSGNGYNFTQATTSNQPTFVSSGTNGLSLLRFNGTNQYLGGGTTLNIGTNDIAVFAVCKYAAGTTLGSSYVFAKSLYGGAASRILFGVQSMGIGDGTGGNIWWQGSAYESSYTSYHSVQFVTTRASGTNTYYANGTQFYQINPGVDTSTNWSSGYNMIVGGYNNPSGGISPPQTGLYMNGDICEILIYAATITTTQRQTIESYLAQKWGLTASLPAGHPGLTTSLNVSFTVTLPKQKIYMIPKAPAFIGFSPTSIAGCALWFDAADATTFTLNGALVSSWRDKSGNGYSVGQSTPSNQPTYAANLLNSLPGIQLSLSTYLYQLGSSMPTFASASTITVFMVAKNGSTYSSAAWNIVNTMWFTGANTATYRYHFSFALGATAGVTIYPNQGAVVPLGSNAIIGFTLAASGISVNVNGNLTTFSGSAPTSASDSTWFMFGDARNSYTTDVNIYEFIGFTTTLTTTQRQTVESYLAQKWGLTSSLPTGHPGLTTTVYGTTSAPAVRQKIGYVPPVVPLVSYTQAFSYTGADQTFVVPATTTSITVYMWGAGGGGGHTGTQGATAGGAGAYVQGTLAVTPNSTLKIIVGGGGAHGSTGSAYGGGGSANAAGTYGGGGGRSAIQVSGTELVDAGGGGGAGYDCSGGSANFSPTINGGAGYPGSTGASWPYDSGAGGTQTGGGAAGPGNASSYGISFSSQPQPGTSLAGGVAAPYAGGGGSGYYGGGGGNTNDTNGAGGGGGSSYTTNAAFTLITGSNSSNGYSAPASGSSYYVSGVAAGSTSMTSGGNGRIVLVYMA